MVKSIRYSWASFVRQSPFVSWFGRSRAAQLISEKMFKPAVITTITALVLTLLIILSYAYGRQEAAKSIQKATKTNRGQATITAVERAANRIFRKNLEDLIDANK